jgi:hypothetical protein
MMPQNVWVSGYKIYLGQQVWATMESRKLALTIQVPKPIKILYFKTKTFRKDINKYKKI